MSTRKHKPRNKMGKVRYLGSKARLVDQIGAVLGTHKPKQRFVDLFCGTGIVSRNVGQSGWPVVANDFLLAASTITTASLLSHKEVPFKNFDGYEKTVGILNRLTGVEGFFYKEYSPSSQNALRMSRPYFSEDNAKKIDSIRTRIRTWSSVGKITTLEKKVLLADLIGSANQVANIAGTYGCFLKKLSPESLKPLCIQPRPLHKTSLKWKTFSQDAFEFKSDTNDVVYLDPPYTKRQYAAYYHIPETIACEDEPVVTGITGLRPWETKASPFCYKAKAPTALRKLLDGLEGNRVIISYSSEGHIEMEELLAIAKSFGKVKVMKVGGFGRYAPNSKSRQNAKKQELVEYIIDVRR
jgi:adenine-specific DNA-methyltransferase